MDQAPNWYLMKHDDGTVFGPIPFEQLRTWASEAQISPLDKVSTDQKTWTKAPMIPELGMDYLVEVSPDQYYGPTTMGAVREFLEMREITADSIITTCKDGIELTVGDFRELRAPSRDEPQQPVSITVRHRLQPRMRELE